MVLLVGGIWLHKSRTIFFLLPELFFQVPELWATSRRLVGEAGEVRVVTRVAMPVVHWITFRFENLIFLMSGKNPFKLRFQMGVANGLVLLPDINSLTMLMRNQFHAP